jgi:hypothetical protein
MLEARKDNGHAGHFDVLWLGGDDVFRALPDLEWAPPISCGSDIVATLGYQLPVVCNPQALLEGEVE